MTFRVVPEAPGSAGDRCKLTIKGDFGDYGVAVQRIKALKSRNACCSCCCCVNFCCRSSESSESPTKFWEMKARCVVNTLLNSIQHMKHKLKCDPDAAVDKEAPPTQAFF